MSDEMRAKRRKLMESLAAYTKRAAEISRMRAELILMEDRHGNYTYMDFGIKDGDTLDVGTLVRMIDELVN